MTILYDRAQLTGAVRITPEGYFVADALVARGGNVQEYRASELGLTDRQPGDVVRVYRPEHEVFSVDSLKSASRLPITLDHPVQAGKPVMVDATNWREFAKGETGEELLRDGEYLRVPIRVTDAGAVTSVQTDRQEFSLGYGAKITMGDGTSPTGEAYDAIASDFQYNHLAACRTARGGPELRIVDERTTPAPQGVSTMKIVVIDGLPVDVSNADIAAQTVANLVTARDTAVTALGDAGTALTTANTTIAARDAEIVTLKEKAAAAVPTPGALRDAAASYARTSANAKALGATITDAMDEPALKAAAVTHKMGDATKAYTPEQNAAAFDALVAGLGDKAAPLTDALAEVIGGNVVQFADAAAEADKARAHRQSRFETAHNGTKSA